MTKKTDSLGMRFLKRLLPGTPPVQRPINEDANSNTLMRIDENDLTYKAVMDHAIAQFANDMDAALDVKLDAATRLSAADSAAGVKRFIEDLEYRRAGWNEERIRLEREEQSRKKAAGK